MSPALQLMPQMQQQFSSASDVLTQLFKPEVNLVVWQRSLPVAALHYAKQLAATQLTARPLQLQQVVPLNQLPHWLQHKLPEAPGKAAFVDDLVLLSQMLGCLFDCPAVGLRLKTLEQPMCPRFHTDHVAARLLVTYAGTGTEWLATPPQLTIQPQPQQLAIADVAILKGSAWAGNAQGAIWHRSPSSAEPRLLLTLDPVDE